MAVTPTFEEYVWSHVRAPWMKFTAYDPRTPWEDQETIDERTELLLYNNIDLSLALIGFGVRAYFVGAYQATNTLRFYQLAHTMSNIARLPSAAPVVAMAAPIVAGYAGVSYSAEVLASTPGREHEEAGLWQTMAQALTGTGPGVGGWNPGY